MDSLFILAGLLGLGDILLLRLVARERARRQKAERHANAALRDNLKLMSALERKASGQPRGGGPVIVELPTSRRQVHHAIAELQARQAAETGGVA
jgi:hypothetical protein